jgi:hypothetical protein
MLLQEMERRMRQKLTLGILIVCAILVAITWTTASSHAKPAARPAGTVVKGDGCLRAGVEGGCFTLTTTDKKNAYSLHFDTNNKPSADTMIHFEGSTVDVDTCMQGTPVKVTKWNALKMKCPAESK